MAGFMKNAMSYLGMSDVVDDEDDLPHRRLPSRSPVVV